MNHHKENCINNENGYLPCTCSTKTEEKCPNCYEISERHICWEHAFKKPNTPQEELGCPHGRPAGQICPHCSGINDYSTPEPKEEWEMELRKIMLKNHSHGDGECGINCLYISQEILSFISNLLKRTKADALAEEGIKCYEHCEETKKEGIEQGRKEEHDSWANQTANEHDNRIRREIMKEIEKHSSSCQLEHEPHICSDDLIHLLSSISLKGITLPLDKE